MTRIAEARELAARHGRLAARLTPHHRMHTVALTTETEEAAADWAAIRELRPRIEKAVEENADTPCVRNARSLLVCAVAHEIGGDPVTAGELERATTAVGFATHSWALVAPRIRLAVIRRDPEALQELLAQPAFRNMTFGPAQIGARMDGLALVHDRERIEAEAPPLLQPGTMVEPFALRALGIARNDDALVDRADERFAVLGLEWHRSQTATLRDGL